MGNYKVKNVSLKTDLKWTLVGYSVIVCAKSNEDFTTAFFFTVEDFKSLWIMNKDQAMALVWQSCEIQKSLKLS